MKNRQGGQDGVLKTESVAEQLAHVGTTESPIHRAVWDAKIPTELFSSGGASSSAQTQQVVAKCLEIVRRRRDSTSLFDSHGKVSSELIKDLAGAGYWGMLVDTQYGGQGATFASFCEFLIKMASIDPMTAGMASIHGCIGAVDPIRHFGNAEQKKRFLPRLASGEVLSGFALTEKDAGSDLTALRMVAVRDGNDLVINGEKLFITNAVPGRTIGLVVMLEGKPAVVIVQLPEQESDSFQIIKYGLHALRHTFNNGLKFSNFRVPVENLLVPTRGDGLTIAYHGLNKGRLALCANASGTMRIMLSHMLPWIAERKTYGEPIKSRELVKRRVARLASLIAGADALVGWGAGLIDQGHRGELECVVAKIFGSEALKEAAIEIFMKTCGGRSFLHGHFLGDNLFDLLAPCIYEGEGEMLGLGFFKALVKNHGKAFFEPIGKATKDHNIRRLNMLNPHHVWALRQEVAAYAKWVVGQKLAKKTTSSQPKLDPKAQGHFDFAVSLFQAFPLELSTLMGKYQMKLADRQCRMAEISQRIQDTTILMVTALSSAKQEHAVNRAAGDILCQDLRRKIVGGVATDSYFKDCGRLADMICEGDLGTLALS